MRAAGAAAAAAQSKREGLESLLQNDLLKRREELEGQMGQGELEADRVALEARR